MTDNAPLTWPEQKEKLKNRFSILSDRDFQYREGEREMMLNLLQTKLGKTRVELHKIFAAL